MSGNKQESGTGMDGLSFEDAMKKLEELADALSREDVPLDEAISVYEQGLAYYGRCKELLEDAQRRVLVIEGGEERER